MDFPYGRIADELFSCPDRELLSFVLSPSPSQPDLDKLLEHWDLEAEGSQKALLLSYVLKSHPELSFHGYSGPRLSGLLSYYRFRNVALLSEFSKLCSSLRESDICPLLTGGAAIKALKPEFPRDMSAIDILVASKDFDRAVRIAGTREHRVSGEGNCNGARVKCPERAFVNVVSGLRLPSGKGALLTDRLIDRASPVELSGVECLVPSCEDLSFIYLLELLKSILSNVSPGGVTPAMYDLANLISSKEHFDWDIVCEDASLTSSLAELSFISGLVNTIIPGLIPGRMEMLCARAELERFVSVVSFRRYCLLPLQAESHHLKVGTVLRNPSLIVPFLRVRPKYTFLKLFGNSSPVIDFFGKSRSHVQKGPFCP